MLIALPAMGQLQSLELQYKDSGCATCSESLEARLKRMRGVEEVHVDPAAGRIRMKMATENRVAIEQVRDFIEQGGSKVGIVRVWLRGELRQDGEQWSISWAGGRGPLLVTGANLAAGGVVLEGSIAEVRPPSGPLVVRADKVEPR